MAHEHGGRADKLGNRFELNWVIYQLLEVISERKKFVIIEAIGDDEKGVDLWVGNLDGSREGQQCKSRHGSDESWTIARIDKLGILSNWKKQLSRGNDMYH